MTTRLLLIDDDARLSAMVADYLRGSGYEVAVAGSLAEGREAIATGTHDALVLDLMLPDGDGFDLVDWLRADPSLCRVPLVVYSALDVDEQDRERLRLGPTEFYTKTRTNPAEVERQVLKLLDTVVTGAAQ